MELELKASRYQAQAEIHRSRARALLARAVAQEESSS